MSQTAARAGASPQTSSTAGRAVAVWSAFAVLYAGLTLLMFWPVVARVQTGIPHDVGDPVLNTWILWWNSQAAPFTAGWWNAPAFWPMPDALALSEHLAGLIPASAPLRWAGAGPHLTYNLVLLMSWPLSAMAAHLLAHRLTGQHGAGLIAGLIFGFSPYRLGQTSHIQVIACWWMPIALYALHRAVDAARQGDAVRWTLLFVAAWLLQTWTNGYFFFYFSAIAAFWWLFYAARPAKFARALLLAGGAILGVVAAAPSLLKYKEVHARWTLGRPYDEIVAYSADLTSWVTSPDLLWLWPLKLDPRPEQALYPGVVAVALLTTGVLAALFGGRRGQRWSGRISTVLLVAAAGFAAAAAATLVFGPWEQSIGPFTLSGRRARRPLGIAVALVAIAALVDPRLRAAVGTRSHFAFYTLAAILGWLMCFGPSGRVMREAVFDYPPYWWLMHLPGADGLRVPTRFTMVAVLPLAIAGGLAFSRLTRGWAPVRRLTLATLCALAVTADSWPRPLPVHDPPQRYSLPETAGQASVIELPLGEVLDWDVAAMARGMEHGRPVVNGYSGHVPLPYALLARALRERDRSILPAIARFGPLCVVIDGRTAQAQPSRVLALQAGARLLGSQGDFTFYMLDRTTTPPHVIGEPAAVRSVRSLPDGATVSVVHDGREDTVWESGTWQRGEEALEVELAAPVSVRGVTVAQGVRAAGYPRALTVETSEDGVGWTTMWEGQTGGLVFVAATEDPVRVRFTIPFAAPQPARLVRLRQTGAAPGVYWAMAELEILR